MMFGGTRRREDLGPLLGRAQPCAPREDPRLPRILLLLDEPTNHLDQESVDAFLEALDAFEGAVVIVTHVERVLSALATRLVVFDGGKVEAFDGGYADFLERVGWSAESGEASARPRGATREHRRDQRPPPGRVRRAPGEGAGKPAGGDREVEREIVSLEERVSRDDGGDRLGLRPQRRAGDPRSSLSVATARRRIAALYDRLSVLGDELLEKERGVRLPRGRGALGVRGGGASAPGSVRRRSSRTNRSVARPAAPGPAP
jgi:ATP-binding cassette subfamily F protein 3